MNFETEVKLAIYRHFAETGNPPSPQDVAERTGVRTTDVVAVYPELRAKRVLALESDGVSIRMAPPFSGVPTQHVVIVDGTRYFANCAWDALGVPAALQQSGEIHSQCEQSRELLHMEIGPEGPVPDDWLFHCQVDAAHWWDDIVYT